MFSDDLKKSGWEEVVPNEVFRKGDWKAWYDTSSVLIIENKNNPNIFPISHPNDSQSNWTVHLIEEICTLEDERFRLTQALKKILKENPDNMATTEIAQSALSLCVHRWLPEGDGTTYRCAVCGTTKRGAMYEH